MNEQLNNIVPLIIISRTKEHNVSLSTVGVLGQGCANSVRTRRKQLFLLTTLQKARFNGQD